VPLKLSGPEERLHWLGKSTEVSESRVHSTVSLPKSAIHKIEIIVTTPKSRTTFQDGTAVVRLSGTAKV